MSISVTELIQMMGGVQGIDWTRLAQQGKGTIFDAEYITDYMKPAYGRALAVFNTLDFKPETDQALIDNYKLMKGGLSDPVKFAEQAFRAGASAVLPGQGFSMTDAELRAFTYYVWLTVTNGTYMHHQVLIHYAIAKEEGGQLSDAGVQRIVEHAEWVTTMCNVVDKLNSLGVFKPIKKAGFAGTNYVNGMGALPVVAVVIIAIAAIAALAYLLLGITEVSAREATVYTTCRDAAQTGDSEAIQLCRDLSQSTPKPAQDLANTVMIVAGLAAAGYALIAFGPSIAQSLKQALEKKAPA